MKTKKLIIATIMTAALSACSSTEEVVQEAPQNSEISGIPSWVLSPSVEDGLAATSCVKYSGNLSIDKKMATANGRVDLAQQIETRISNLDKTYSNRVDSNDDITTGSTFSSVSKQLTKQTLVGSRVVKADIITIADKQHFCVLTTLTPNATKELFDAIVDGSKRKINPEDSKFLYQEFKAYKAEQNLDKELKRLTK